MWFFCQERQREKKEPSVPEWAASHPAWLRLVDQLSWYDSKSIHCQRWYKGLMFSQIVLAVSIPITSHLDPTVSKWLTSIAGGLIAILEGVQHINQYSTLWFTYRATAERLKHEKFLFLSGAGPYKGLPETERLIMLAERVEEHVSTEHANWFNETRQAAEKGKQGGT